MLNKTPRVSAKKIKLALKLGLGLAILLIVGAITYKTIYIPRSSDCSGLQINRQCINLERMTTDEQRMRGLSGRDNLSANKGMLFVFESPAQQCFWMKDMKFPIDMVFINHKKQIVKIYDQVKPSTYPESFCADDVRYVVELNAGYGKRYNLYIGQALDF